MSATEQSTSTIVERLSIRADATVEPGDDGRFEFAEGPIRIPVGPVGPGVAAAIQSLVNGQPTELDLVQLVTEHEGELAAVKLQLVLNRLRQTGWLTSTVALERPDREPHELAQLRPIGHSPPARRTHPDPKQPLVLSRFAHMRVEDGETIVESPRFAATLRLTDPRLATLLAMLATPRTPAEIETAMELFDCAAGDARALMRWLASFELVVNPDAEDDDQLALWSFADLLFHARSRVGRNLGGYGGSYRFEHRREPLPAIKPVTGETVELPKPPATGAPPAMTLTDAIEQRRALREHDSERPITVAELSELLYRTVRVRAQFHDGHQQLSSRPYPGGGALYELELYPLIDSCDGLEPGLYRYDAQHHRLETIKSPNPRTALLMQYARLTAQTDRNPQVLLLLAARFGRAMWKYESMAYALVLKDVGVLYQSLSLMATAMGLAACPLGGGPSDAFCAAADVDFYAESSVGEIILGRPAQSA